MLETLRLEIPCCIGSRDCSLPMPDSCHNTTLEDRQPRTVTVFAGSSMLVHQCYYNAAFDLGAALAKNGFVQCNGGGFGVMEACTNGAISQGGTVDCVILRMFSGPLSKFRDVVIEDSIVERKNKL